jgi:hypothetical protein
MPIRVPPTLPTAAHPLGGNYTQVSLRGHELFPMFVPRRHSEKRFTSTVRHGVSGTQRALRHSGEQCPGSTRKDYPSFHLRLTR